MSAMSMLKAVLVFLAASFSSAAFAQAERPAIDAAAAGFDPARCVSLYGGDFSDVPEAPTMLVRTRVVAASSSVPAYCEAHGVIRPNVGFVFKLPGNWNGKFFMAGCGNWCGVYYPDACDEPVRRGYACIQTDAGNVARPGNDWTDGQWADSNLQAELDYGGRASHVAAVAGKAIARHYYGRHPQHSYFMGCSYGGHQSMVLAQRFPHDFDGIIGGGSPNNLGILMQQNLWALRHGSRNYASIFSEADLQVLHRAVLAQCDMDDGVADRLVGNPPACRVDPSRLVCRSGQAEGCISSEVAQAAARMYSGPVDSRGRRLSAGGWEPGSELFWRMVYREDGSGLAALGRNYFRYIGRWPDLGPGWSPDSYDFDQDPRRNDVMETLYVATNPDLRRFRDAGGRFINFVGWNDLGTLPSQSIDYYETASRTMGGQAEMQNFFRMFIIPGAVHCRPGAGAGDIDFISYLEAWVERGAAPHMMVGAHRNQAGQTLFTRPVYPWPQMARYRGTGNPNEAANFRPVTPR